jgi:glycosyltransferase involved in cell wall biosynthesis
MKLIVCGAGKREEVQNFISREKLDLPAENIKLMGYQSSSQLKKLFKKSFCMIHPSYMDNSPNSVCESQIAGLPVVAAKVGGVDSLIKDQETGLLVNRYDHKGLSNQISRLLEDGRLYRKISENSREVARTRHDREKIVSNTMNIYNYLSWS